jgi:hypothetical protein
MKFLIKTLMALPRYVLGNTTAHRIESRHKADAVSRKHRNYARDYRNDDAFEADRFNQSV